MLPDPGLDDRLWKVRLAARGSSSRDLGLVRFKQDVDDQQECRQKDTDCHEIFEEGHGMLPAIRALIRGNPDP
jgi:hypothetical protein